MPFLVIPRSLLRGGFIQIFEMTGQYTKAALHCHYLELYLLERLNNEPRLLSYGHSGRERWENRLQDDNGNLIGQIAYVFTKEQPLWITGQDNDLLSEAKSYRNHFREGKVSTADIPLYRVQGDNTIRSSISFPLLAKGDFNLGNSRPVFNPRGVLTFESKEVLEPTKILTKELMNIVNSISLLFQLAEHNALLSTNTKEACKRLDQHLESSLEFIRAVPLVGKSLLFLATSARAPDDIVGEIRAVLDREFSSVIDYYHWNEDHTSGNIHLKLWDKIRQARYGIFYLSETDDTAQPPYLYKDNVNVLYEAGMMQAQQERWDMTNLIIIREEASPEIQFDLIAECRITVPRSSKNLNQQIFRHQLIDRLKEIESTLSPKE